MSSSMSPPWIRSSALRLLASDHDDPSALRAVNAPRMVQVRAVCEERRRIEVSDQQHSVEVYLTDEAVTGLGDTRLKSLKYAIVKLERWLFSTQYHCAAHLPVLEREVLVLQCSRLRCFSGGDLLLIGDPQRLQADPELDRLLRSLKLNSVSQLLAQRQLGTMTLPLANGVESVPFRCRDLRRADGEVPHEQLAEVEAFEKDCPTLSHAALVSWRRNRSVSAEQEGTQEASQLPETLLELDVVAPPPAPMPSPATAEHVPATACAVPEGQGGGLSLEVLDASDAGDSQSRSAAEASEPPGAPSPSQSRYLTQDFQSLEMMSPLAAAAAAPEPMVQGSPMHATELGAGPKETPHEALTPRSISDPLAARWRRRPSASPPSQMHMRLAPSLYRSDYSLAGYDARGRLVLMKRKR